MSQWLGAIILVVGFIGLFQLLGLTEKSKEAIAIAHQSTEIIRSAQLSDEQKESRLQKNSQKLFGLFFILAVNGAIAILIPLGILWLGDRLDWLSLDAAIETTLSPTFLVVSGILAIALLCLKPDQKSSQTDSQSSYSALDRILHQLAFNTYTAQIALADVEDRIFSKQLATCNNQKPVFITALPRAGTTLLLELCADLPEFAAHCYRDLPFVLIPCLWNRFSRTFQQTVESTERAQGDGMKISPDSYEALEEVIWHTFWQRHYHGDRIIPWDYEENEEFNEFFHSHMQKIILLRRPNTGSARYISKNNANIARIKILQRLFTNATIIIPFRDPLQHASSLLQQHLNFLQIHQADSFTSEYMKAIGHYDFGENLRPLDFNSWFDRRQSKDARTLAFWLEYWAASYQYLLHEHGSNLNFFDYDKLCQNPIQGLKNLAEIIESRHHDLLISSASRIRQPRARNTDVRSLPAPLLSRINSVHASLKDIAQN